MKKLNLLLLLAGFSYNACTQETNHSLPAEFRDLAARAFLSTDPALKQWFADAANQHPEGRFDSSWTLKKLNDRFGAQNLSSCEALFMVMMEYQRMQNKEARENRNVSTADRRQQLAGKEKKLETDNKQIDRQMEEARQKADQQMTASQTDFWLVVVNTRLVKLERITDTEKKDSSKQRLSNDNRVVRPARVTTGTGNTGDNARDQRKDLNDAVSKLLAQIGEINKVAGL